MTTCGAFKKYQAKRPPKCNCESCWEKYFRNNQLALRSVMQGLDRWGRKDVIGVLGEKYLKHMERFIKRNAQKTA